MSAYGLKTLITESLARHDEREAKLIAAVGKNIEKRRVMIGGETKYAKAGERIREEDGEIVF